MPSADDEPAMGSATRDGSAGSTGDAVECEAKRIEALRHYDVLGTPPDEIEVSLVDLTARLAGTPMALLSFVEADRERVRAASGAALEPAELEGSFGGAIVASGADSLVVADVAADERFAGHAWVTGPARARFYAGVAVKTPGGVPVGTLAVLDTRPRADGDAIVDALVAARRVLGAALERKREAVLDAALTCVVHFDGTFLRVSRAWRDLLGYAPDEMLGRPFRDFVHPDDVEPSQQRVSELRGGAPVTAFENRYLARDGSHRWLSWQAKVVSEEQVIYATAKDVTALKSSELALRESEGRYRLLAENATDMIARHTLDGRMQYVSRASEAVLARRPDELVGTDVYELVHPDDRDSVAHLHRTLLEGADVVRVTCRLRHRDGHDVWVESLARTVVDDTGEVVALQTATRDISERRRAEEELRHAREAAEHANRAKSAFLSRMSHELRTPLNAIMGFAQLLELEQLTADQRDSVARILRGGQHLVEVIDDVLDISRIEAGELAVELEPIDVGAVAEEIASLMRPLATGRGISIRVTAASEHALADRQRLKQILLNLIANAIKYGPPRAEVVVHASRRGAAVRIGVVDEGPGLSPEEAERVFAPFERLSAHADVEGTGLGLSVSRNLAVAMGGRMGVRAAESGSEFWVELAAAPPEAGRAGAADVSKSEDADTRPHTILLIEDTASNVQLVERIVARRSQARLLVARDGGSGIDLARGGAPDVIVLDVNLPDMHGADVLERLRSERETAAVPVIVVTADASAPVEERMRAAGAVAFARKPLDVGALGTALDAALRARRRPAA